ncbi:U3 small nucleolar RNA-associated protein 18 [Hordeum vulgare]|nr:U3 small nucleolar RNA-associated protein 18 [Hordeum vulgare]
MPSPPSASACPAPLPAPCRAPLRSPRAAPRSPRPAAPPRGAAPLGRRPPCRATAALLSAPIPLAPASHPALPALCHAPLRSPRAAPRLAAAAPVPLPTRPARPSRDGPLFFMNRSAGNGDHEESFCSEVDENEMEPSSGPINFVQFHRNGLLMLDAGLDKRLRFFQMDGRRKFFYSFDLVKAAVSKTGPLNGRDEKSLENFEISPDSKTIAFVGNEGYILLISSKTKQLIGTLKMNGNVRSLAFVNGGNQLIGSGGDDHVYHWDVRTRKCIHKATDEGSLTGLSLCTSQDSSYFATGSSSGIVNLYNRDEFLDGRRKQLKTIKDYQNLTVFSCTSRPRSVK